MAVLRDVQKEDFPEIVADVAQWYQTDRVDRLCMPLGAHLEEETLIKMAMHGYFLWYAPGEAFVAVSRRGRIAFLVVEPEGEDWLDRFRTLVLDCAERCLAAGLSQVSGTIAEDRKAVRTFWKDIKGVQLQAGRSRHGQEVLFLKCEDVASSSKRLRGGVLR